MAHDVALTDIERDALTELVNIGVSRAASSLRKMIGEEVLLSVPSVEIMPPQEAARLIGERETDGLVAIQQYRGSLLGRALLIFPEATSMDLVRAIIGSDASDQIAEPAGGPGRDRKRDLERLLRDHGEHAQAVLTISLPEVLRGWPGLFALSPERSAQGLVLFLYINFSMRNRDIRGYIAMLMDLPSLTALKMLIADFIDRIVGGEAEALPTQNSNPAKSRQARLLRTFQTKRRSRP